MKLNKVNTSALDRVMITNEDAEVIRNEIDKMMKDKALVKKVMESDIPLDLKGVVSYQDKEYSKMMKKVALVEFYYDCSNPVAIELTEIDKDGNMIYRVKLDVVNDKYDTRIFRKTHMKKDEMIDVAKFITMQLLDFMKYAQLINYVKLSNPIIVNRAITRKKVSNHSNKPKKKSRTVVSISKPKRIYDYGSAELDGDKRSYERQAESWEVMGHWRHYKKTDKRVFVKGYKKGEGAKKGKDFRV